MRFTQTQLTSFKIKCTISFCKGFSQLIQTVSLLVMYCTVVIHFYIAIYIQDDIIQFQYSSKCILVIASVPFNESNLLHKFQIQIHNKY